MAQAGVVVTAYDDAAAVIAALSNGGAARAAALRPGADWYAASADRTALQRVQQALGGELLPADDVVRAGQRMGGYVPPCRVLPDADGHGSYGVHLDQTGACPFR